VFLGIKNQCCAIAQTKGSIVASIIPIDPVNSAIQTPIKLLRQVRDAMTMGSGTAQSRLDGLVRTIADAMHADVCSIYFTRPGDILELYASYGLKQTAVHITGGAGGRGGIDGFGFESGRAAGAPQIRFPPRNG
jgi:hypothetical protein